MKQSNVAVGIHKHFANFRNLLISTTKNKGAILAIAGEAGLGKSNLLMKFNEDCNTRTNLQNVFVENQAPVGSIQVGQIQPLLPFSTAIDMIIKKDTGKAEKKFAINVGMTMLASIPLAGDLFYAVKELSKDWRQFKKEKNTENLKKASSLSVEFYETIMQLSTKSPVVMMLDDMHWCDAQSVELLGLLAETVTDFPIFIIFSYKKSVIEGKGTPLYSFIQQYMESPEIFHHIELEPLTQLQSKEMLLNAFPEAADNGFDKWIFDKSLGVPGVIAEYLKYFEKFPDKIKDFNAVDSGGNDKFLPTSLNAAFSQVLEMIGDDEKNILAICSSEGREFTALIVSNLLNVDVLTTIKKLRNLQHKTGLIRSLGAKNRYGVKTTVYEFTQAFYYNYFQATLEFEENTALHGQIAALLKQRYNEADAESVKSQIAPYLAAHSSESGDEQTAKEMMLKTAEGALEMGNADMVNSIYNSFKGLNLLDDENGENSETTNTLSELKEILSDIRSGKDVLAGSNPDGIPMGETAKDFCTVRNKIVDEFHLCNYSSALDKAKLYYDRYYADLSVTEKAQLLALLIRLNTELLDMNNAEMYSDLAFKLLAAINDPISESFVLNAFALLKYNQGKKEEAYSILRKTAQRALSLPIEVKLITLSNIANLLNEINPKKAGKYYKAITELTTTLKFDRILEDIRS